MTRLSLVSLSLVAALSGCQPASEPPQETTVTTPMYTAEDAAMFVESAQREMEKMQVPAAKAAWLYATNINEDTATVNAYISELYANRASELAKQAAEFNDVNTTCRQLYGRAFSRQSLHLRSKIAEVNRMEREGFPVIEVHPELSFTAMNAGQPLTFSKKTWGGFRERISLLEENGLHLTDHLLLPVRHLAPDDIVDAAAAAWSAYRHSFGGAISYPPSDQNLREPRIWA